MNIFEKQSNFLILYSIKAISYSVQPILDPLIHIIGVGIQIMIGGLNPCFILFIYLFLYISTYIFHNFKS